MPKCQMMQVLVTRCDVICQCSNEAKDMSSFVDDVKELVDNQQSDIQRAFRPHIVQSGYKEHLQSWKISDTTPKEHETSSIL